MKFFTVAGWVILTTAIISILTGRSETIICTAFIMSQLAFIQANIELIGAEE